MAVEIVATTFPAIALVLGVGLSLAGYPIGILLVLLGAVLQGAWLLTR